MNGERASITDVGDGGRTRFVKRSDLLQSHEALRSALMLAGQEIRKLNFGRRNTPLLDLLRRVYREAGAIAEAEERKILGEKEDFLPVT